MTDHDWLKKQDEHEADRVAHARQIVEEKPPTPELLRRARVLLESSTPRELHQERRRLSGRVQSLCRFGGHFTVAKIPKDFQLAALVENDTVVLPARIPWRSVTHYGHHIGYIMGTRGNWVTSFRLDTTRSKAEKRGTYPDQARAFDHLQTHALVGVIAGWSAADQLLEGAGDYLIEADKALARLSPAQGEKLCRRWLEICRRRQAGRAA